MTVKRYIEIAAFFLIAPLIEWISGNVSSAVFLDPPALFLLCGSYGSAALLAREMARRWHKGFASIFLLGAAYALINEGLMSGGFFDPHYGAVVAPGLENFGRWGGINTVWALGMIGVHAVFSIAIPIVIVDALFPENEEIPLLGKVGLALTFALLIATSAFGRFVAIHAFSQPPINPYAFALVVIVMILLMAAARALPPIPVAHMRRKPGVLILFICGLAGAIAWFSTFFKLHTFIYSPLLNIAALLALLLLFSWLLLKLPDMSGRDRLALAAGAEVALIQSAIRGGLLVQAAVVIALLAAAWVRSNRGATKPYEC